MSNKLSIKVNLADRMYPLEIERKNEEAFRKAAKLINEKVTQYKQKYKDKDNQDFLAMAALQLVTKYVETKKNTDMLPIIDELKSMDSELKDFLKLD
ncbi:MAG: cell division protein ZapA [Marinifilaceae bacterium]|jgi:cell division protein ZapA|nr:cell division protein ZapA [Marinifilaceae bacterium]